MLKGCNGSAQVNVSSVVLSSIRFEFRVFYNGKRKKTTLALTSSVPDQWKKSQTKPSLILFSLELEGSVICCMIEKVLQSQGLTTYSCLPTYIGSCKSTACTLFTHRFEKLNSIPLLGTVGLFIYFFERNL